MRGFLLHSVDVALCTSREPPFTFAVKKSSFISTAEFAEVCAKVRKIIAFYSFSNRSLNSCRNFVAYTNSESSFCLVVRISFRVPSHSFNPLCR
jgi:hypothetical protein